VAGRLRPVAIFLQPNSADRFIGPPFWFFGQRIAGFQGSVQGAGQGCYLRRGRRPFSAARSHADSICGRLGLPRCVSHGAGGISQNAGLTEKPSAGRRTEGGSDRKVAFCYMIILVIFSFP